MTEKDIEIKRKEIISRLYDWYDDYDEFEVCKKENDMRYGICKDWKEFE